MTCKTCKHAIFDPLLGDYKCSKMRRYVTDDEFRNGCDEYVKGTPTDSKETKTENIND
jgi:hypothetical protein